MHGTYQAQAQDHKTTKKIKDDYHCTCEYCLGHQINCQIKAFPILPYGVEHMDMSNTLTCIIFNKILVDAKSCILISNYKNPD